MKDFDFLVKEVIGPILKENGFKKTRHVWNKLVNDKMVYTISIQKESITKSDYSFTMNFGIYVVGTNDFMFDKEVDLILSGHCVLSGRPRFLNMDFDWWKSEDVNSNPEIVESQIKDFIISKFIPFVNNIKDINDVLPYLPVEKWKKNTNFNADLIRLACGYYLFSKKDEAIEILNKIYLNKEPWFEVAEKIIARMG